MTTGHLKASSMLALDFSVAGSEFIKERKGRVPVP